MSNLISIKPVTHLGSLAAVFPEQNVSIDFATNENVANETAQDIGIGNVWSVSVWWKDPTVHATCFVFSTVPAAGTADRIVWFYWLNNLRIHLHDNAGDEFKEYQFGDITIKDAWNFITVTWNGADLKLYCNGSEVTSPNEVIDNPGQQDQTSRYIRIAGAGSSNYMTGRVHSVGIWNTALTVEEHGALYNGGNGKAVNWAKYKGVYTSSASLVHWWRLGFNSGDIGADYGKGTAINVMDDADNITAGDDIVDDAPGI